MDSLKHIIHPIHREGLRFIAIFAIVSLILMVLYVPLGWLGVIATLWCVYFFRDPERVTPVKPGLMVSPADGIVIKVANAPLPPEMAIDGKEHKRISIFLNVFDVHVNRLPVAGKITAISYYPGKFFNASLDKASEFNERNTLRITTDEGEDIIVVQIAGLVARRIVCDVKEGDEAVCGARFGIIRFGSRVDVYLPEGVEPLVLEGQKMIGGETIIADLSANERPRTGIRH